MERPQLAPSWRSTISRPISQVQADELLIHGTQRRMRAADMLRAVLGFDPTNAAALALYRSLGFRATCSFVWYRKEV